MMATDGARRWDDDVIINWPGQGGEQFSGYSRHRYCLGRSHKSVINLYVNNILGRMTIDFLLCLVSGPYEEKKKNETTKTKMEPTVSLPIDQRVPSF